jgi:hypothetical protein
MTRGDAAAVPAAGLPADHLLSSASSTVPPATFIVNPNIRLSARPNARIAADPVNAVAVGTRQWDRRIHAAGELR